MTVREMYQWLAFMEMQQEERTKDDWYQAQIAYMIYLLQFILGGSPKHKLEDFLLKFAKPEEPTKELTPQELREKALKKAKASQQIWQAVLGKKAKKTVKKEAVRNSEKKDGCQNPRGPGPG